MQTHSVIVIPGLGDGVTLLEWAVRGWSKLGITPYIFHTRWRESEPFKTKLSRALALVDSLPKHYPISIVGNSAGSSLALNIYGKRRRRIQKVVVNCGRVRDGDWPWFTFKQATSSSPSFKESVLQAQKIEKTFTSGERRKILTLRPLFDEVVPPLTVPIQGATNKVLFTLEHGLSIALNLSLLRRHITDFILS